MEETRILAEFLSRQNLQKIFTSPLERCKILGQMLAKKMNAPLIIAPEFQELSFGSWEGLMDEIVQKNFPEQWRKWKQEPFSFAPGGGESFAQLTQRVLPAFYSLGEQYDNFLIITHLGVIQVIISDFLGISVQEFSPIFQFTGILFYLQPKDNMCAWYTSESLKRRVEKKDFDPLNFPP